MVTGKKDEYLGLRLPRKDKAAFIARCKTFNRPPQEMLREIVTAFNEGRLTITVPETQLNILKGIHHVDRKEHPEDR